MHSLEAQQHCLLWRCAACRCTRDPYPQRDFLLPTSCRGTKEESLALLDAIQGAAMDTPGEVLLDMVGTNDFAATFP